MYEGIGLGLAICKGNLGIPGGEIWLESEPGKGSTFYFNLPYNKAVLPETSQQTIKETRQNKKEIKVLVVEDDETNFEFIKAVLSSRNFNLLHVWNRTEGVSLFDKAKPDLVVLDLKLPDMNGYEVLKAIRQLNSQIPVIAQTAMMMNQDRKKALDSGFFL